MTSEYLNTESINPYKTNSPLFVRMEHLARYIYISEFFRKRRVESALDIACGSGYGSIELSRYVPHVVGTDYKSEVFMETAALHSKKGYLDFVQLDINNEDIEDRLSEWLPFHGICCLETLEHIADPRGLLQTFNKLMKKGGVLAISVPDGCYEPTDEKGKIENAYHQHAFTEEQMIQLLCDTGFKVVRTLYQHTAAQLHRNERRAIRDMRDMKRPVGDTTWWEKMSSDDIRYYSRIFAWPEEYKGASYTMIFLCQKKS